MQNADTTRFRIAWITGVVLLLGILVLVSGAAEERRFGQLLHQAEPSWLLAALFLQALTYTCAAATCAAAVWQQALSGLGDQRPLIRLVPLGLAKLFTDQAVPSAGLSGTFLVVRALKRRGISGEHAMAVVLVGLVAYYLAYALVVIAALTILWLHGDLNRWLLALATVFSILVVIVPFMLFWLHRHPHFKIPSMLRRLPGVGDSLATLSGASPRLLGNRSLLARTTALQVAIFLLDAATLGTMLLALGIPAGPSPVFVSFVIASVVATTMVIPGGVGTFEGSSVGMLHLFGVPLEAALAATLLLRGFTFWLPMLPGLWLARREML